MKPCGHRDCTRTATWRIRNLRACDQHKAATEHMYPGVEAVPLEPAPPETSNEGTTP